MKSIPKLSLLVLGALSIIVGLLFFVGGADGSIEVGGESIEVPKYADPLIYWSYILLALSLVVTVGLLLFQYVEHLKTDFKAAIKSLIAVAILAVIMLISFFAGSGEEMKIIGYEGADNSGFWAQFTDMCLYATYILIGGVLLALVGSAVYKQMLRK